MIEKLIEQDDLFNDTALVCRLREEYEAGYWEGYQQGLRQGLLISIESMLKLKFGETGLALLIPIRQIEDTVLLEQFLTALATVTPRDIVWQVYAGD